MKKYFIFMLFLIVIFFTTEIGETNGLEKNRISFQNLNSNKFVEFVKEKQLANRITKICTTDFCDYARGSNIETSFELFQKKYEEFLIENGHDEIARTTILKGFPIVSVNILD